MSADLEESHVCRRIDTCTRVRAPTSGGDARRAQAAFAVTNAYRSRSEPQPRAAVGRRWVTAAAIVLVVAGVALSFGSARTQAQHDEATAHQAFQRVSLEVASSLQLAIQREQDLVVNAGGFFLARPDADSHEFTQWSTSVQAMQRYPELIGWAEVVIVRAEDVDRFVADRRAAGEVPAGPFTIVPAGSRPYYCLLRVGQNRDQAPAAPVGFDYCAATSSASPLATFDPGKSGYSVVDTGSGQTLAVQAPFYRGGVTPPTVEGRRDAFVGWMGMGFDPDVVLRAAVTDRSVLAVRFSFNDTTSDVSFQNAPIPEHARTIVTDLHNGWTVETFGPNPSTGILGNASAVRLLAAGALAAVVVGVLVFLLGTGRARAVRLVAERTGELRHQALHDPLTGLPNRALITDRIEQLLVRNRRQRTSGAAMFIDLDDFKNVNDTLGHLSGDRLLVAVAARLTSAVRDADTIGRMGGDEFVVLIDGSHSGIAPELVAERLIDLMRVPFQLEGTTTPLTVNTSIGIAVGDRSSGSDLLRDADIALYAAKRSGKNHYETFQPEMYTTNTRRSELEAALRVAVAELDFRLVYEPIYDLEHALLVGVEARLRWEHPTLGPIDPSEFLPVLEQSGQILDVGQWILAEACRQMAMWHRSGDRLDLAVSLSDCQLGHDAIIDHIRDALASSGLAASSLIVGVKEQWLIDHSTSSTRRLHQMRELGVRLAIDDFGTGYASIAALGELPLDCLKIDRHFTDAISTSLESRALIGALVELGRHLGLRTLAEGVQTPLQMNQLRDQNVTRAEGFPLLRPNDAMTLRVTAAARPCRPEGSPPTPVSASTRSVESTRGR
ncbi:MAG: hypothetical protein JWM34_1641 [Ilumatobacteraceae bacterium]|nr:hypothetical protein [Ilumatobacteraceae bacterium]